MLINGRYQILHPLQEGGFGHTFLAEDTQLPSRRRCVIKQLKPIQHNPEFYKLVQERFQREAAIQETLGEACPEIPRLYAYFEEGDHFYLVEEWVEGQTLRQKVNDVGLFAEAAVQEILCQLLSTVEVVHQHQIIHRDIKPDNVILRQRDGKPVLIDFGAVKESMATIINSKGQTARSIVIGTAGYMAPEQSAGRPVYGSDLYSLGLTAIYLLTGKTPAELDTDPLSGRMDWRSQTPQVSDALAHVIDTAVQLHPGQRFTSAAAMRQALQTPTPIGQGYEPTVISRPRPAAPPPIELTPASPSAPQRGSVAPTQMVAPAPVDPSTGTPAAGSGNWLKPILIGGSLGGVLLLGLIALRAQSPSLFSQPTPSAPVASSPPVTSPSPSPIASDPPPSARPVPPPSPPASPAPPTAKETCGDPGGTGVEWYPVFIDGADVNQIRQEYCRDAIAKVRDNGTPAVQVASFTDRQRAVAFAQEVGGDVGLPYRVGGESPAPPSTPPAPPLGSDGTNAVIVGNKGETNIRRGPGTQYGVQHIAYPGDRVKILASGRDVGGYLWYKIYFPKSGASGWIAGQLLEPD